jgi:hypothetical protein
LREIINFIWVLRDLWESKKKYEKFNFALKTLSLISHCSIFLARKGGQFHRNDLTNMTLLHSIPDNSA